MKRKYIVLALIGTLLLASCTPARANTEYCEHELARKQVHVYSATYDYDTELEWYELRTVYSEELDQMTTTYWLFSKGKQEQGDIAAFAEIYNPEDTSWAKRDFTEMVIELTRFDWAEISVKTNNRTYTMPSVASDNDLSLGYLTFRVPIRR